jgi:Mitochondrial carrier protein
VPISPRAIMPNSSGGPSTPLHPSSSEHGQPGSMANTAVSDHGHMGLSENERSDSVEATTSFEATHLSLGERILLRLPEHSYITIAGGLAGAASGIVSCPLDVIKTKLQAQGGFMARRSADSRAIAPTAYRGVVGTSRTIWREDGIRGMYRGLGPMLLGYVPTWAVYLTVYNASQRYFNTKTGESG